jgi:hypothetical protein
MRSQPPPNPFVPARITFATTPQPSRVSAAVPATSEMNTVHKLVSIAVLTVRRERIDAHRHRNPVS